MNFLSQLPQRLSAAIGRAKKVYLLVFLVIVGVSAFAVHAAGAWDASAASSDPITPALKLAQGTIYLEGTDQAVDPASAATLLPLWQLLEQLDTSSSAAPEEVTSVVEEIQLTMTPAQITAIEAMKIATSENAETSAKTGSSASTGGNSGSQLASADSAETGPILGDMPADAAPMDGAGAMPSGTSKQSTSASRTPSTGGSSAIIKQVIQLLESKVQS